MLEEKIKLVSVHVAKHRKPESDEEFGHYLAGLIEGGGSFGKGEVSIAFNNLNVSLAYFIKKRIGYGTVRKVKDKECYILKIGKREGVEKVLTLINGKLRTEFKKETLVLSLPARSLVFKAKACTGENKQREEKERVGLYKNILANYWASGFIDADADASFQVRLLERVWRSGDIGLEVRMYLQIGQKKRLLAELFKKAFGGNMGLLFFDKKKPKEEKLDTYYYSSTSLGNARKVINYLDKFHMLSSKHLNFLKWRKIYLLVQEKKHLTPEGKAKIQKIKASMVSFSKT